MTEKMLACREVIAKILFERAKNDKSIMVLTTDARFSASIDIFAEKLPEQFIDVGIAEQNAIGIAAGLSKMGKKPFVFSPACFVTSRCVDQIKVDVVYSRSNVKIIGVSGGVSYGALGYTHHAINDIAIMRSFPNMIIILPSDPVQAKAFTEYLVEYVGPVYVRVGRNPVPIIYEDGMNFEIGKANILIDGTDVAIIGIGETTYHCLKAGEILRKMGISAEVVDMPTVKPLDTDLLLKISKDIGAIIVVEEHTIHGGLGSAIAEFIVTKYPALMEIISLPDDFVIAGTQGEVLEYYGLTCEKIAEKANLFLSKIRR